MLTAYLPMRCYNKRSGFDYLQFLEVNVKGNEKILEKLNDLLADELTAINQYMVHSEMAPVYNEFVLRCPAAQTVNEKLQAEGIIGGYELSKDYPELADTLLFCATEMLSKDDMDCVVEIIKQ